MSDDHDDPRDSDDSHEEEQRPRGALTTSVRSNQIARTGFSETSLAMGNSATEALVASARAMTEARWIMAMRNPRNILDVRQEILDECKRPGFAEVATYARPVGRERIDEDGDPRGKKGEWVEVYAEGLSIRFAEVAMRRMRNMQCKATVIYDDARQRVITVYAVDYESNATWETDITVPKTVERKKLKKGQRPLGERLNSYGDRVFIVEATDSEVAVKAAAEISKASRTAILRLIPGEIQDEAHELCKTIAANKAAKDPRAAIKRMLDSFAELAVKPSEIEAWLGHKIEAGTREEFLQLSKIASGIREGELIWPEVLAERIAAHDRERAPATSAGPAAPPAAPPPPADPAKPPPPAATPAQTSRPAAGGKGTAALRGALRSNGGSKAEDPREAEPGWMSGKGTPPQSLVELPPGTPPPAEGNQYRGCARCGAIIEVPLTDALGGKCYACTAGERDA